VSQGEDHRVGAPTGEDDLVWYVSYGSNMEAHRFSCYLTGGTPLGGLRAARGARDARPPRDARPVWLAGQVYFALESLTWTGGVALLDPDAEGEVRGRAYLITAGQFTDVAAQEMRRTGSVSINLPAIAAAGRVDLGPGRYERLLWLGELDGHPLVTFTAPWSMADVEVVVPATAYRATIVAGLMEGHGLDPEAAGRTVAGYAGAG
jgi:hypothetical protein